ncbi:MAG: xanthine dehydrogenase family protein molybdopterin-binding subunit [Deltaproteobacteria bacterium]|nr:xanthine dehydrogenase family protein molybdopterin-binding subunit [Deltaproteobacteria bacterium]
MRKQRLSVAGHSSMRVDAVEKVSGSAFYTGDMELPAMAYAKILRSPLPHARLLKVDAAKARALPGVVDVLTRDELGGLNYMYGATYKDQAVVAVDKVRYVGDPVAAVLSADELVAEEALSLIDVEYEELPFVDNVDDALAPGAPRVHEGDVAKAELRGSTYGAPERFKGTNVCYYFGYSRGNVEQGFDKSDHVFEDVFRFSKVQHYSLEPHICVANFDGERLTVWSSCQDPFTLRGHLAGIFKLPLNRVRVVVPYVGGGYGGKLYVKADPIAAALSVRNRRPVKLAMSANDSFKTVTRHPARIRIKTGVSKKGEMVARELEVYMDTGAYADAGPRVTQKAGYRAVGPYRVANVKIDAHGVYSNTVPAGAFRGFGAVQVAWAYESQMDMIANRLGMDPLDFRLKNLLEKGEPYTPGDTPVDCDLKQGLRKVARRLDWKKPTPPNVGRGLSVCLKDAGGTYKVAGATVKMSSDGSAVLLTGTVEVGQGCRTALSQVVAEELGIELRQVSVAQLDTDVTPFDVSTSASSSMTVMGLATQRAAQDVKKQLLKAAAKVMGEKAADLTLKGGQVRPAKGRGVPYSEVIAGYYGSSATEIVGRGGYQDKKSKTAVLGSPTTFWEVGWGGVELEVDPDTGVIRILKYVSMADVGRAINPLQCEGQDEGGVVFAIGHTLMEDMVYENGQPLNPNLIDYRVPNFHDVPEEFISELVESGNGPGPFGAKGMGEGGVLPAASAIAAAVEDAVGVRICDLPLSPPKVWQRLREKESAG